MNSCALGCTGNVEDTKGTTRCRKAKKDRQYSGYKKKNIAQTQTLLKARPVSRHFGGVRILLGEGFGGRPGSQSGPRRSPSQAEEKWENEG